MQRPSVAWPCWPLAAARHFKALAVVNILMEWPARAHASIADWLGRSETAEVCIGGSFTRGGLPQSSTAAHSLLIIDNAFPPTTTRSAHLPKMGHSAVQLPRIFELAHGQGTS